MNGHSDVPVLSAVGDIHGQPAQRGFLVLLGHIRPGLSHGFNTGVEGHKVRAAKRLPSTLLDALRLLEKSKILRAGLGEPLIKAYLKLKMNEWQSYTHHLSEWERANTLDC